MTEQDHTAAIAALGILVASTGRAADDFTHWPEGASPRAVG